MYRVKTYPDALQQLAALPDDPLAFYAQALGVLEPVPWNGDPLHHDNPDGAVRTLPFGSAGMITYLVLEDQHASTF